MKTVVVLIEKIFVCPVAVSIPDWWDEAIARQRLSTPESLGALEDIADPCGWEETNEEPAIRAVGAPGGPVTACLEFGADDQMPAHPAQLGLTV